MTDKADALIRALMARDATPAVSPLEALRRVEEALGNNLVWLDDALDLRIRQGDKDAIARLAELNAAWITVCKTLDAATPCG